ncbi:MAG: transcriptional regulator GlxA family with amidase domain [Salinirussus sp.]|jgi:transcriptional regulator GlxA family with amidase domain
MSLSHAGVLVYEGFEPLDAVGPYELLSVGADRLAGADAGDSFETSLCTTDTADQVTSAYGMTVGSHGSVAELDPDLLVVPGGGWNDRAETGTWAEAERGVIPDLLAERAAAGTTVAGVCTGGMLLARAGLLEGRPAVTHAGALADLRETDAEVVEARVVDAGDVLTCGGVTAGLDLALYLLEREYDTDLAAAVARTVEHERRGPVHDTEP